MPLNKAKKTPWKPPERQMSDQSCESAACFRSTSLVYGCSAVFWQWPGDWSVKILLSPPSSRSRTPSTGAKAVVP